MLALIPSIAPRCDAPYHCHRVLRSVGPFRTIWNGKISCMLSKIGRVELSVRLLLGLFSLCKGRQGHEPQAEIILHSHQLLLSKPTIVKALELWFHRGDWWNRKGTKVGLIQLHRSQNYSNTSYRLKDECLWPAGCLIETHPTLCWDSFGVGIVRKWKHGNDVESKGTV